MINEKVIIAGGGIGGLSLALTLHQIGVPCVVLEASREMRPLGVGINIQPNAVRELIELGLEYSDLDAIGVPALEWALVGLNGKEVYAEPRGLEAGYRWPQYAVHRGQLLMLLYNKVVQRLGEDAVQLDARVTGYKYTKSGACNSGQEKTGVTAYLTDSRGNNSEIQGQLLIGADGIHSAIRAQMYPCLLYTSDAADE